MALKRRIQIMNTRRWRKAIKEIYGKKLSSEPRWWSYKIVDDCELCFKGSEKRTKVEFTCGIERSTVPSLFVLVDYNDKTLYLAPENFTSNKYY